MENNGSPSPIFETNDDRTYFITTILIHEGFKNTQEINVDISVNTRESVNVKYLS